MKDSCIICSSLKKTVLKKGKYLIRKCGTCGFGQLQKRSSPKEIKNIYSPEYFLDKQLGQFHDDAKRKFSFLKNYLRKKTRVLDFGCGLGDFISICKNKSYMLYGYEISSYAADFTSQNFNIPVKSGDLKVNLFRNNFFDVIVVFDVIEHVPDFKKAIKFFHTWLKPEGLIIITTPNTEAWDAKLLGRFWYGFIKLPEHINFFSPRSVRIILEKGGFKIVKIKKNWGFVRDINFFLKKMGIKPLSYFGDIKITFPMTDMLVLARNGR